VGIISAVDNHKTDSRYLLFYSVPFNRRQHRQTIVITVLLKPFSWNIPTNRYTDL